MLELQQDRCRCLRVPLSSGLVRPAPIPGHFGLFGFVMGSEIRDRKVLIFVSAQHWPDSKWVNFRLRGIFVLTQQTLSY